MKEYYSPQPIRKRFNPARSYHPITGKKIINRHTSFTALKQAFSPRKMKRRNKDKCVLSDDEVQHETNLRRSSSSFELKTRSRSHDDKIHLNLNPLVSPPIMRKNKHGDAVKHHKRPTSIPIGCLNRKIFTHKRSSSHESAGISPRYKESTGIPVPVPLLRSTSAQHFAGSSTDTTPQCPASAQQWKLANSSPETTPTGPIHSQPWSHYSPTCEKSPISYSDENITCYSKLTKKHDKHAKFTSNSTTTSPRSKKHSTSKMSDECTPTAYYAKLSRMVDDYDSKMEKECVLAVKKSGRVSPIYPLNVPHIVRSIYKGSKRTCFCD